MSNFYTDNSDLKFHLSHPLMKRIVELKEHGFADKDKYDFAPVNVEDALDSYEKIIEIVGDIAANIMEPNAEANDKEGHRVENGRVVYNKYTKQNYDALTKAGLMGITLPRKYAGLNMSIVPYVMAGEIISRADGAFANFWGLQDCAETIYEFANEDIRQKYLPRTHEGATYAMVLTEPDAGSDLQAVQLKATFDEKSGKWLLNGVKRFITNGDADIQLVLARSEEGTTDGRGLSLFVYDKSHKAVTVRRVENKLGIKGSPTTELVFKNAPAELVGERRLGLIKYVMSLMNGARLGVGGQSVGIAEAAYREALKYAHEREQFGKPIIEFPAVYEMLTNMQAKLRGIRSLLYETSRFVDMYKILTEIQNEKIRPLTPQERKELKQYKRLADFYTPLLKLFGSEYANQISYDAIQIHGGTGYMKDFPIERIYRDARITSIYEGTSQLQVVAAIRGVTTGAYLNQIRVYEKLLTDEKFADIKAKLIELTGEYEQAVNELNEMKDNEYLDFHARRLVEMAGNIIISYLLALDSIRDSKFETSAIAFFKMAYAQNKEKLAYIRNFNREELDRFKEVI